MIDEYLPKAKAELLRSLALASVRLLSGPQPDRKEALASFLRRREVKPSPTAVQGLVGATAIAGGAFHCLALLEGGSVVGWGANEEGQLGDGTRVDRSSFAVVRGLEAGVVAVAAGASHSVAVLADHTVVAWGSNGDGRLGDGSSVRRRLSPVKVAPINGRVVDVAAGGHHSLALTDDGSVFMWGSMRRTAIDGADGKSGTEAPTVSCVPLPLIGFPAPVRAVAAGNRHSMAATAEGSVFEWTIGDARPSQIRGLEDVVAVAAGDHDSLALRADGTVWGWGLTNGKLRDPAQVVGLTDVVAIATAYGRRLALRADGSVWTMGGGQAVPEPVGELTRGVRAIAVGYSNLALLEDGSVSWWWRAVPPVWDDQPMPPDDLPLGTTKLGGRPDLPMDTRWPAVDDAPHSFVAQVNLRDVQRFDGTEILPADGILSFFYDGDQQVDGSQPSHRNGWAVLYTPGGARLARRDFPDKLLQRSRFRPVAAKPQPEACLPSVASLAVQRAALSKEEKVKLWELEMEADHSDKPHHRLLGHEQPVQPGHIQALWCQRAVHGLPAYGGESADPPVRELEDEAGAWRLLLQVDSDGAAGIQWGDLGRIYYWIRADDLAARRFDRSWLIYQCH